MHHAFLVLVLCAAAAIDLAAATPLISDVPDQTIASGSSTPQLFLVVGDAETAFADLVLAAASGNPNLVPNNGSAIVLPASTKAQRSIRIIPAEGQTGVADITLTVTDTDGEIASSTFKLTVTGPNSPPSIAGMPGHRIVYPGLGPDSLAFTLSDAETAAGDLTVTARSSNQLLVRDQGLSIGGNGGTRSLQVIPEAGATGVTVLSLEVADGAGWSATSECIWSVVDPLAANTAIRQPAGIYLLDSSAGSLVDGVSMRDGNLRSKPFLDGYVLRVEWATLEPSDGGFSFAIIDNILAKLPAGQKLSLLIGSGSLPAWLLSLPGVTTWSGGTPTVTRPLPWDAVTMDRYRRMLTALAQHPNAGVPLRDDPRLAAINGFIPGLKSGIRDPDEIKIRDMPGYSRDGMRTAVLTHLDSLTESFPSVPVQIGFWTYTDRESGTAPWEELRQAVLARFDGTTRPRVGFWMENLAAHRPDAEANQMTGLPNTSYAAALFLSQTQTFVGYQVLGSWSRPFSEAHVDNNLNGSPQDAMDYALNTFQCRYYEHYQADVDFPDYTGEFQRWRDFIADLPRADAGTLRFAPVSTPTGEAAGTAFVTVSRSGGSRGPVAVAFATTAGTASASDYTDVSGSLSWADGDLTDRTIAIPIIGDGDDEPDETLHVVLRTPTGGAILDAATPLSLTIADDDIPPASTGAERSYSLAMAASAGAEAPALTKNADGTVTIRWTTSPGSRYQIETSGDGAQWRILGSSQQAAGDSLAWTDDGTMTGSLPTTVPRRLYRIRNDGMFTVTYSGNALVYTDAQRELHGIFIRPAGTDTLPALIINHGTGGRADGYSLDRAREMSAWGMACIAIDLTHMAGEAENLDTWGYSPENLARNQACLAILAARGDIDMNRVAVWGHSRGAFASIGVAAACGSRIRALGFSAGGIRSEDDGSDRSMPTTGEADAITAATLIFHGTSDPIVPAASSLMLRDRLASAGIAVDRITPDTSLLNPQSLAHNLHQTPAILDDMLVRWRAWLIAHGVLP